MNKVKSLHTAVGVLACVLSSCHLVDPCGNTVINESSEPGGEMKVVVFERDCGATTGFSTQVSVMRTSEHVSEKGSWVRATQMGNAFQADTNHGQAPSGLSGGPRVQVAWRGPKQLQVAYDKAARVFLSASDISGVKINYVERLPNTPLQPTSGGQADLK